jgi:hypothetical protein
MNSRSALHALLALPFLALTASAAITGHWDFDNTATPFEPDIGAPIQYLDPNSDTPAQTQVNTTTAFGIPNINGAAATVMKFGTNGFARGYLAPHGIAAANGPEGSSMVNKWTVIMDVLFPASSSGQWRALVQTDPTNPVSDDAEAYLNESNALGLGSYGGNVPANTWVRLAVVGDLAADPAPGQVRFYINGNRVGQITGTADARFALLPASSLALFTDGYETDVYTQPGYINSLQIHNEALSDAYLAALGSPAASGIATNVQQTPFARNISPSGVGASPEKNFFAIIENALTKLNTNSIRLTLNGQQITPSLSVSGEQTTVAVTNTALFPPGSTNTWVLIFSDNATPAAFITNTVQFVVANYQSIDLPQPLYFEDFESTPEGSLPAGWTNLSFTEITNPDEDLGNLDSATYARWTVVDSDRFLGSFVTYSNPDNPDDWETDYQRVLNYSPNYVVANRLVKEFASGKFAFGNSGYRNGASQVLDLYTPDFNLTGHTNVHLAFNSIWEQNQDSIAGVEYSTDQGATWKPVIYMIDRNDLITNNAALDAIATLNEEHGDVARYTDNEGIEHGGTYGAFIKAPINQSLAPFISGRIDDDSRDSKRIELFRLPGADNQANVRFRFFHAGTDSWYFGIDNFGLYNPVTIIDDFGVHIARSGDNITITWAMMGRLEKATSLTNPDWQTVTTTAPSSHTEPASGAAAFYRLRLGQ